MNDHPSNPKPRNNGAENKTSLFSGLLGWIRGVGGAQNGEDSVRDALEEDGAGRVLVIAGGGSTRCALVGGNLGQMADDNGWAGILVDGCVRDVGELRGTTIGIRARGSSPRRSVKRGAGERDVQVRIGEVDVSPGMWLWADEDGIVLSDRNLEG